MRFGDYSNIFFIILFGIFLIVNVYAASDIVVDDEIANKFNSGENTVNVIVQLKEAPVVRSGARSLSMVPAPLGDEFSSASEIVGSENIVHKFEYSNSFSASLTEEEMKQLEDSGLIESVFYDFPVHAMLSVTVPLINANDVWNIKVNQTSLTGSGQTVCVVDSGVDFTHSSLFGRNLTCNIDCYNKSCVENCSVLDDYGHGTHVAGIVASQHSTYKGVAPGVNLIGVKVLNSSGSGLFSYMTAGIGWCVNHSEEYNISVISISIGGDYLYSDYCDWSDGVSCKDQVNLAVSKGISVVVAAGNSGSNTAISFPACLKNVTRVGATTLVNSYGGIDEGIAGYNRWKLDMIMAPGTGNDGMRIYSTFPNNSFISMKGTSMATPHVSGAIAIINQYFSIVNRSLIPSEIEAVLEGTGEPIYNSYDDFTYYRVDVLAAIDYLMHPSLTIVNPTNNSFYNNNTLLVNISSNGDNVWFSNGTMNQSYSVPEYFNFSSGNNTLIAYSNFTGGNLTVKNISFYIDSEFPQFVNQSLIGDLKRFTNATFNLSLADNYQLKNLTLETNITGVMQNYSQNLSGAETNKTFVLNITSNKTNFSYRFYLEDFVGNINTTDWSMVQVQNTLSVVNDTYTIPRVFISSNYTINKSLLFTDVDVQELNITVTNYTNLIIDETQTEAIISLKNKSITTAFLEFTVNDSVDVVVRNFTIDFYQLNVSYPDSNINISVAGLSPGEITQLDRIVGVPILINSPQYGMINFSSVNITTEEVLFMGNINISSRRVEINSDALPFLNTRAIIILSGVTYADATIFKDGEAKACTTCSVVDYNKTSGIFTFSVLGFSVYEIKDRTCFDGVKNGPEVGVDCGGPCASCSSGGSSGGGGGSSGGGGGGGAPSVSVKSAGSRNIVLNNASEINLSMNVNDSIMFFVESRGFGLSVNNINDSYVSFNFSNEQYNVNFSEEFLLDISVKGYENTTIVFERINETSVSVNLEVSSVLDYAEDVSSNNVLGLFNIVDYWKEILVVVIVCAMILIRFFVLRKMNSKRRRRK